MPLDLKDRWAALPRSLVLELLELCQADLDRAREQLVREENKNQFLRLQGEARHLSRRLAELKTLLEGNVVENAERSQRTGY